MTDRPGWNELRAVRTGRVHLADGNQWLNRPGPRVVETLEIIVKILGGGNRLQGIAWLPALS